MTLFSQPQCGELYNTFYVNMKEKYDWGYSLGDIVYGNSYDTRTKYKKRYVKVWVLDFIDHHELLTLLRT